MNDIIGEIPHELLKFICKQDLGTALKSGVKIAAAILNIIIKRQKCQRHVMKAVNEYCNK